MQVPDEWHMSIDNDPGLHDHGMSPVEPKCINWCYAALPHPATNSIDDIQVEYHPNSGKPTEKYSFAKFTRVHAPKPYKHNAFTNPWYPFHSRLDFDFADLALEAALSKEKTNWLLKLVQCIHSNQECFTLCDYKDVENLWKATSHCMPVVSQPEEHLQV